jgi:hypothetical protein
MQLSNSDRTARNCHAVMAGRHCIPFLVSQWSVERAVAGTVPQLVSGFNETPRSPALTVRTSELWDYKYKHVKYYGRAKRSFQKWMGGTGE